MSFDPFFADILACPLCRSSLEAHDTHMVCKNCDKAFPVRDEIPFLLPEEARPVASFPAGQA